VAIIFPVHPYDVTLHVGHVPIPRCYFRVIKSVGLDIYMCIYISIDYIVYTVYTPHCRQHNTDNPPMFPEWYFSPLNNMPFMDKKRQTILLNIITGTDSVCSTRVYVPSHRYIHIIRNAFIYYVFSDICQLYDSIL